MLGIKGSFNMKYIGEFCIIILISFIGETLNYFIPLPIPGSVYGLAIMLFCLCTKIIKLDNIKTTSKFIIEIMPLMFIPAGVGLITSYLDLKPIILEVTVIVIVTTVLVMGVTGVVCQLLTKKNGEINE